MAIPKKIKGAAHEIERKGCFGGYTVPALTWNSLIHRYTTTLMEIENENDMMTAEATSRLPKDHHGKKSSGKPKKVPQKPKDTLSAVSEYSLSGFLDAEPDLYSVADVKVRYR